MPYNSIGTDLAVGYAGQLAEPGMPKAARSCTVEAALSAGAVVKRGTDPEIQVKPLESGDLPTEGSIMGVAMLSTSRPYEDADAGALEAGKTVSVLRFGSVYMQFAEAVTAGEVVGQALSTGLMYGYPIGTAPGDLAAGRVLIPGLRIASTTSASGPAIVEVNLFGVDDDAAGVGDFAREGATPAFAANDCVITIALAKSGTVFDVPTTGAASTVTLPASVSEGTVLEFVADGTKNGHTVQYRDATGPVNLTAALTASKRHQVRALFVNGIWTAAAAIAP